MAEKKSFKFRVDDKNLETDTPVMTGRQIKARAGVDASFGLFIEGHGHDSDKQVGDDENVDLREPGKERFHTAPPATYGR